CGSFDALSTRSNVTSAEYAALLRSAAMSVARTADFITIEASLKIMTLLAGRTRPFGRIRKVQGRLRIFACGPGSPLSRGRTGRVFYAVSKAEHEQHRSRRGHLELGRERKDRVRLLRADQDGNVLLAVDCVGHRRRVHTGAKIDAPKLLQRFGIVGRERAVDMAGEDEVASGREHASEVRIGELLGNLDLSGGR